MQSFKQIQNNLASYSSFTYNNIKDPTEYFACHENISIIEIAPHQYCTRQSLAANLPPHDIRVSFDQNIFIKSQSLVYNYGYAIAADENGSACYIIEDTSSSYYHHYEYNGGLDMWFLDSFSCLFLHDCNEFSVELCNTALTLWRGSRLILVGKNWEKILPALPDLPGIECYWEDNLTDEKIEELQGDLTTLHVIYGIPHNEDISRFNSGIAYYDEVMSFTYLFSKHISLGEDNPDKEFCIIDGFYSNLGLFALYSKASAVARYAKAKGFIPLIRLQSTSHSIYSTDPSTDVWNMFFCQPEEYSLKDIENSKHVTICPAIYNGTILSELMGRFKKEIKLSWPNGIYNNHVKQYLQNHTKKFLPYPESTLGVLIRGTDYVKTKFINHPIHATPEMVADKIDEIWNEWGGLSYIFLATEDAEYCEYFSQRYAGKIFFTNQQRFSITTPGDSLTDTLTKDSARDGFILGVDYLLAIHLLAKCRSFIASGGCAGEYQARLQNGGKYEHEYVFQLGLNS